MYVAITPPEAFRPHIVTDSELEWVAKWRPFRVESLGISLTRVNPTTWRATRKFGKFYVNQVPYDVGVVAILHIGDIVSIPNPIRQPWEARRNSVGGYDLIGGELVVGLFSAMFDGVPFDMPGHLIAVPLATPQ